MKHETLFRFELRPKLGYLGPHSATQCFRGSRNWRVNLRILELELGFRQWPELIQPDNEINLMMGLSLFPVWRNKINLVQRFVSNNVFQEDVVYLYIVLYHNKNQGIFKSLLIRSTFGALVEQHLTKTVNTLYGCQQYILVISTGKKLNTHTHTHTETHSCTVAYKCISIIVE